MSYSAAKTGFVRCRKCGGGNKKSKLFIPEEEKPLYFRWHSMIRRCTDPKSDNYIHYGKRGISVCDEWLHNFKAFRDWMFANGYTHEHSAELSVERVDNDGPYSPENCTLIPMNQQMRNRRTTVWTKHPATGADITATEYAELCGKSSVYITNLIRRGRQLPPIPDNAIAYHITAYAGVSPIKTFKTRDSLHEWCNKMRQRVNSCLTGKTESVIGYGWYYTDDDGNRYKRIDGEYVKDDQYRPSESCPISAPKA